MFYFILFVTAFLAFASGECPKNTLNLFYDPSICYSFHSTPEKFIHAQNHCESFGANLISFKTENTFISQFATLVFDDTKSEYFWSGGYRFSNKVNFNWVSGDKFGYENFIFGEKDILRIKSRTPVCISVLLELGEWKAQCCSKKLPFICQFEASQNVIPLDAVPIDNILSALIDNSIVAPKNVQTCKDGWVYYGETKSCYFASVFDAKNWKDAEAACREEGAHLVSIHSEEENIFVMETLVSSYKFDEKCLKNLTWIGFLEENNVFSWTDGTPNDFTDWSYGESNNAFQQEHCGPIYTHTCDARQSKMNWNDFFCVAELPYVCKMPANL